MKEKTLFQFVHCKLSKSIYSMEIMILIFTLSYIDIIDCQPCSFIHHCNKNNAYHTYVLGNGISLTSSEVNSQRKNNFHIKLKDDTEHHVSGVRLNKCFKEFASRRESDRFIEDGRVAVNGQAAKSGDRVFPGDRVTLDGKVVNWERLALVNSQSLDAGNAQHHFEYIKYWKPRGVTSTTDRRRRDNIVDAVGAAFRDRIYPVGRLDKETTGIILLTSDGRLPDQLGRREQRKDKVYVVTVDRRISDGALTALSQGVEITTKVQRDRGDRFVTARTQPCQIERLGSRKFSIVLQEGRNRQIRKMCEAVGCTVVELHRDAFCGIGLKGMKPGEWKKLSKSELGLIL